MSLDFDARFPRFRIGSHDRVTIEGNGFRLLQQMDDSFVVLPAEGTVSPRPSPLPVSMR